MATSSRRRKDPVLQFASAFHKSISSSGRFSSKSSSESPSSSSSSSSPFHRPSSPTRVNLHGIAPPSSSSVRFSIDRSRSPGRSMTVPPREQVVRKQNNCNPLSNLPKRTCLCSPTTHPGSFRCSLHKNSNTGHSVSYSPNRLNFRRSAMANSLIRIGTVEGDWVKRALAQLVRPSSHQLRRRTDFQPKPSRFSIMSKADDT